METLIGRITLIWILLTVFTMGFVINDISDIQIFKFGPNSGLFIMDICIDTNTKYFSVVIFCFVNSGVRSMNHNILQSWLINTVQNKEVIILVNIDYTPQETLDSFPKNQIIFQAGKYLAISTGVKLKDIIYLPQER